MVKKLVLSLMILTLAIFSGCKTEDKKSNDVTATISVATSSAVTLTIVNGKYVGEVAKTVTSVTITVKANHSKATVKGDIGVKSVVAGENKYFVTVTAENDDYMTYNIVINKEAEVVTPTVTSLTLNTTKASITVGGKTTLTAIVVMNPVGSSAAAVTFTSSNTTVAAVNASGVVTAGTTGTAVITAKAGDVTATAIITVVDSGGHPEGPDRLQIHGSFIDWGTAFTDSVMIDKGNGVFEKVIDFTSITDGAIAAGAGWVAGEAPVGTTANVAFKFNYGAWANGDDQLPDYGLDAKGFVAVGSTLDIIENYEKDYSQNIFSNLPAGKKYKITVDIKNLTVNIVEIAVQGSTVSAISLNTTSATIKVGDTVKLTANVVMVTGAAVSPIFTSSNEAVATIAADGTVTAKTTGTAIITATAGGKTATATITVEAKTVETIRFHYFRYDGSYTGWGLHLWVRGGTKDFDITTWASPILFDKTDDYGKYVDIVVPDLGGGYINYIIHKVNGAQTSDLTLNGKYPQNNEFWAMELETILYTTKPDTAAKIAAAEIVADNTINVTFNGPLVMEKDKVILKDNLNNIVSVTSVTGSTIIATLDANKTYTLTYNDITLNVKVSAAYIEGKFIYTGNDLGAIYNAGNVAFKLWAPTASQVKLNIYDKSNQNTFLGTKDLVKGSLGVWSLNLNAADISGVTDLDGYFYDYDVTVGSDTKKALDPYAKSLAEFDDANGGVGKAAIVNPATLTTVTDFANIAGYTSREKAIIYEVHVRDFTSDENISTVAPFGTYRAFIEKLDYIKSLGVTHIQLLPVMAYYYGAESKRDIRETTYSAKGNNYNWGYDPHSYFAPEGMYATDPSNPKSRVNELRELINAIHSKGMGVTLDVVYNHTAKTDILENIVPGYYYRMSNGTFTSKSGCGNDVASTQQMARKLILDSIKYWVENYKVDGFRFDLMGILDTDTMNQAYDTAAAINPNTLFIGEGWTGMYTGPAGTTGATQAWMNATDKIGCFSDGYRTVFKAGGMLEGGKGFISNNAISTLGLWNAIRSHQPDNMRTADDPGDSVQYLEAHDGLTTHDIIANNLALDTVTQADEIYSRLRLGLFAMYTSQGTTFMHAGQEFGRTKEFIGTPTSDDKNEMFGKFVRNTYDSTDIINRIDWNRATTGRGAALVEYTKGMISLRKSTDAFSFDTDAKILANMSLIGGLLENTTRTLWFAFKTKASDNSTYYVFMNGTKAAVDIPMTEDITTGTVIVDSDEAGTTAVTAITGATIAANKITLNPLTALIIKK